MASNLDRAGIFPFDQAPSANKFAIIMEPLASLDVDSGPVVFEYTEHCLKVLGKLLPIADVDKDVVDNDFRSTVEHDSVFC